MSEDFEAPKDDLDKELPAGSEEHSDYKPADAKDANIKHQQSGICPSSAVQEIDSCILGI